MRLTPAVASNRIKELERRLDVRLFNRTTRKLSATEAGRAFYEKARQVVQSLEDAEAAISDFSQNPHGTVQVSAPLGVGKRLIAPLIPEFVDRYPEVSIRLRLSDRKVDLLDDGIDVALFIGRPPDSDLKLRKIMDTPRLLCAAPDYLEKHGVPQHPDDLKHHNCLLLRYPRSPEWYWTLQSADGPKRMDVTGSYDSDDGDVLTAWALAGRGIINKPRFDVAEHLKSGALVEVLPETPPEPALFGCLYPHRRLQDNKVRLLIGFLVDKCRERLSVVQDAPARRSAGGV